MKSIEDNRRRTTHLGGIGINDENVGDLEGVDIR